MPDIPEKLLNRISLSIALTACVLWLGASGASAQAGVCDRVYNDAQRQMNADIQKWIAAFTSRGMPPAMRDAHMTIFIHHRDESLKEFDRIRKECTASVKPYQDVMDTMVAVYTAGLSEIFQPHMTHVDVSELLAGYPFGGPDALIPRFREQILFGDRGTVSNILRDPWKCLTFQRKC